MKNYIVTYTTNENREARYFSRVAAADYTKAYLKFIFDNPRGVMIIEITED